MKSFYWYEAVYEIVRLIPKGRVTTYGLIAQYLGIPSARMVGKALNLLKNANPSDIPAHRVVNARGELTGRHAFATPKLMQSLLESEGVRIRNHRVVDFEQICWNPSVELLKEKPH